ncbi:MAG: hypothetical protein HUJ25_18180 [Crocinitomicaceae bacterium]|nr:hypothetical protein [Crocinitomicaceae bacterium]
MELPNHKDDLMTFFDKEEFVVACCEQIRKDLLGLTNNPPQFDIHLDEDVLDQLTAQLAVTLTTMSSQQLQQFIYKVDLPEKQYLQAITKQDDMNELSYFVIRREAQKVYLRRKFSSR